MADLTGKTLGNYRILEQIGRGGMAAVFKAYQPSLERHVAIKVIHEALAAEDEQFSKRFQREAKAVAALRHPNIVQVFDFGTEGGLSYMVMEYLEGTTLKAELKALSDKGQVMPLDEVQRIFQSVAGAVDYAAGQGMTHRDLKPANVMLTAKGDVILTDFGIARIAGGTQYTSTGAVMGTPAYMSPEQGKGERGDHRSDIYSLGVMLYEMVTGRVPFEADTPLAVIFKHISDPLPLPRQINPAVPEKVEQVILKALAKGPGDRYQRAADMATALTDAITTEVTRVARIVEAPVETQVAKTRPPEGMPAEPAGPAVARPAPAGPAIPRRAWIVGGVIVVGLLLVAGFLILKPVAAVLPTATRAAPTATLQAPTSTYTTAPTATRTPVPPTPTSVYAAASEVSVDLGNTNVERGLVQFDFADGLTTPRTQGGVQARLTVTNGSGSRYVYFRVDDAFIKARKSEVWVIVEYFDQGTANFRLHYDSADTRRQDKGVWKDSRQTIWLTNSGQWRTATFVLPDAFFGNREHDSADFRLDAGENDLYVHSVKVVKPPTAYLMRIRLTSTSDWATLRLISGANWTNPTLISATSGATPQIDQQAQLLGLSQPIAQAQAGNKVEMVVDVLLTDVADSSTLQFEMDGGCLGSAPVDLFNFLGAEPALVGTLKRNGALPDCGFKREGVSAAGFLKPPP